jgi:nitroreductase
MEDDSLPADQITRFLRLARQTREFEPGDIPEDALQGILDVARWSGSSMNRQVWKLVVIRDRALLARLGETVRHARHFGRAPLVILIRMPDEDPEMDAHDEGRMTERIILAARAYGLGAGIGWVRPEERDAVRELLRLPPGGMIRTGLAIGHPAPRPRRAGADARKPLNEIVQWDAG